MRKLVTSGIFASAAAAAVIALSAPPAFAATWEVTNGGDLSAIAGVTTLVVHNAAGDVTLACSSADATASVPNGQSDGLPVGQITSLNFNDCLLGGAIPFEVATNAIASPWDLNALSQSGDVVTGAIPTGISARVTGTVVPCDIVVSGPANANDGSVPATYDNAAHQLIVDGGGNLTLHNVDPGECADLLDNGDSAEFSGNFDVDPPAEINLIAP
ncbi:MAG: hypothetical protein ACRDOO_18520 [Actinomadura sp.]